MLEKLKQFLSRFEEVSEEMGKPEVVSDHEQYARLAKEYSDLEPIVKKGRKYEQVLSQIDQTQRLLQDESDEEMRELAKEELSDLEEQAEKLDKELRLLVVPPDPNDEKNVVLEIRAGTGGDEAGIFAGDLYRMYQKYCENQGWKTEILEANYAERGGFKEVIVSITGKNVYARMKYESGVHRVQRVPDTETQGRIHTSAASVAVLPEVEAVEIDIDPGDLRIDYYRASGHGGQHVNTTDSAVRIVHVPTGIMATCQDEKSQHKNKAKAMKVLMARLYDAELQKHQEQISSQRRSMIRTGDRSEKIRTYNYPQGRVTDHRINLTLYRLNEVLEGNLDLLIDELQLADQEEKLKVEAEGV
ncbi:MAG: peptide chain release factor 1 [Calditrichia bacterium]